MLQISKTCPLNAQSIAVASFMPRGEDECNAFGKRAVTTVVHSRDARLRTEPHADWTLKLSLSATSCIQLRKSYLSVIHREGYTEDILAVPNKSPGCIS